MVVNRFMKLKYWVPGWRQTSSFCRQQMKIASIFETFWRFTSGTCLTLIGDGNSLKTISGALIFFVELFNEFFRQEYEWKLVLNWKPLSSFCSSCTVRFNTIQLQHGYNFQVCRWIPGVWLFKWKLMSCTVACGAF